MKATRLLSLFFVTSVTTASQKPYEEWGPCSDQFKGEVPEPPVWIMCELEHVGGDPTQRQLKTPVLQMKPLTRPETEEGKTFHTVNLDPENPADELIIDLMSPGTGFSLYPVRTEIGALLKALPCSDDTLTIHSETEPVRTLGRVIVNPKDKRRIRFIEVTGCLAVTPKACIRDVPSERRIDFDFGDMKRFFHACGVAMRQAIKDDKDLSPAQLELVDKGLSKIRRSR